MSDEPKPVKEKKPRTQKQLDATARLVAMNKEKRALKLQALNEQVKANVTPPVEEPTATVIIKKKKAKKSLNIIEENLEKPIEKPIEKQVKPKAVKKVKPPPVEKAPKVPKIKPDHVKKDKPKKKVERANLIPEPKKPASLEESSDSGLSGSDYEYTPKQIAEYTKNSDTSSSESDDDEPASAHSTVPVQTVKISHDVLEAGKGNKKSRFF